MEWNGITHWIEGCVYPSISLSASGSVGFMQTTQFQLP